MAERLAYTQHTAVRFRLGGWARSSLAEHRHDKPRAGSSILPAPTISRALRFWRGARSFKPVRLGSIPARATNPCASGTMDRAPDYEIRRVRVRLLPGAPFRGPIAQWTEQPASTRRIGVRSPRRLASSTLPWPNGSRRRSPKAEHPGSTPGGSANLGGYANSKAARPKPAYIRVQLPGRLPEPGVYP